MTTDEHRAESPGDTVLALAEAAEAEAAAVEAQAAEARARAVRLRRQAETDDDADDAAIEAPPPRGRAQRWRLRRPTRKTIAVSAAIVVICVSLALTGYFGWIGHIASQKQQRAVEFSSAARQDVMALMSLDFNKTKEDMQRISESTTGGFKERFPVVALQLTNGLQRSKVVTTVTVNDVAVESMTDNSAVVLVAATTQAKSPEDSQPDDKPQVQTWHLVLTLQRDKGQPKMSKVEFIQ